MSHDKINQHLEDMQYFPNDQFYGITKLCVGNGLIPRVRSEKGFSYERGQEFIDRVSGIIGTNL